MKKTPTKKAAKRKPKIGIVVAQFNEYITRRLLDGCLDELTKNGIPKANCVVAEVPGSFETPLVAQTMAKKRSIDAVICLGAVIRGETLHFDLVAYGATYGIMQASLATQKPIVLGVLAIDTVEQANQRSKEKGDNKGREAAQTALTMLGVLAGIK